MSKILSTFVFVIFVATVAVAQDDYHKFEVSGGYSFERVKGFPGDRLQATAPSGTSTTGADRNHKMNGFNASAVYNFTRYFGAKFEFSGHYGSDTNHTLPGGVYQSTTSGTILVIPGITGVNAKQRDYRYLGGVQIKDNSNEKKYKPFANALFGSARQSTDFTNADPQRINLIGGRVIRSNSFSMALGGGLDIKVSDRIDIRVIQFDYNPVFTKEKTLVPLGGRVDSLVTGFPGGSVVITLQDLKVPKHTQQNFRFGFGIVFH